MSKLKYDEDKESRDAWKLAGEVHEAEMIAIILFASKE